MNKRHLCAYVFFHGTSKNMYLHVVKTTELQNKNTKIRISLKHKNTNEMISLPRNTHIYKITYPYVGHYYLPY